MVTVAVDDIVQELKAKKLYKDDVILEFLASKGIVDRDDKIEIFKTMAGERMFDYNFVQYHIMEFFSDGDDFVDLVLNLSEKKHNNSLSKLVDAYGIDPVQTMNLYEKILNSESKQLSGPITYLLLGVGKMNRNMFHDLLNFSDPRPEAKVAYIEATRLLSYQTIIEKSTLTRVIELSDSADQWVRGTAVFFLLSANTNDEDVRNRLRHLASKGERDDKIRIGREGHLLQKRDGELCLELVKLCSSSEDIDVLNNLDMTMGSVAEEYPVECLEIFRSWFRNPSLRGKIFTGWAPDQIEKREAEGVDAYILGWIAEEKDQLIQRFDLPKLIWDIFEKGDKGRLLGILQKIDVSTEGGLAVFEQLAQKALSEIHENPKPDTEFVDGCHELISKLAFARGVDPHTIRIDKEDKILLTLAILDKVTAEKIVVDFSEALSNLSRYKNIEQLIGRAWFEELAAKDDNSQPLMWLLARASPKNKDLEWLFGELEKHKDDEMRKWTILTSIRLKLEPAAHLEHIDSSIAIFMKDAQRRLKDVRDGLKNPDQIYQTTGELVLAAHFRTRYPTEMQVKFGKKADCRVFVEGKEIVVEVVNLDMPLDLKYLRTVISRSGNRTKSKIKEKLEEQIPEIAKNTTAPIFLAINRGRAGIDDLEIADALYGSTKIRMYFDKQKGMEVKSELFRERDGISTDFAGRQISGIILYRTAFNFTDCKEKLEGEIFENITDRPVDKELIEKIKQALFNNALP